MVRLKSALRRILLTHCSIWLLLTAALPATAVAETQYLYDDLGRLVLVAYPNGSAIAYEHDADGNIVNGDCVLSARDAGPIPVARKSSKQFVRLPCSDWHARRSSSYMRQTAIRTHRTIRRRSIGTMILKVSRADACGSATLTFRQELFLYGKRIERWRHTTTGSKVFGQQSCRARLVSAIASISHPYLSLPSRTNSG